MKIARILVSGVLLVISSIPVVGKQNAQPTDNKNPTAQYSEAEDTLCPSICTQIHQTKTDQQSKWWPPPPAWDIYWPTLGLLIVAGRGAWLAWETLDDIKTQTALATITARSTAKQADFLITSQRAWIVVHTEEIPDSFNPDSPGLPTNGKLVIYPAVENSGQTIGWIKRGHIESKLILNGNALPENPDFGNQMAEIKIRITSPPHRKIQPLYVPIPYSQIASARKHLGKLYIYGFIEYEIIGGDTKFTNFCLEYHVPNAADERERGWYISTLVPPAYTDSN